MAIDLNLFITAGGFLTTLVTIVLLGVNIGLLKGDVKKANDDNSAQAGQIGKCATKEELRALTERVNEDRQHNNERIKDLYNSRNVHARDMEEVTTTLNEIKNQLGEMKTEFRNDLNGLGEKLDRMRERAYGGAK
jgi:DNA anti-recombination protein RmuC